MRELKYVAFVVLTMFSFLACANPTDPGQESFDLDFAETVGLSDDICASNDGDTKADFTCESVSYEVTQDAVGVDSDLACLETTDAETTLMIRKYEVGWSVNVVV